MLRKSRNVALVVLCGGMLLQGGCAAIILPLVLEVGGTLLFGAITSALFPGPM